MQITLTDSYNKDIIFNGGFNMFGLFAQATETTFTTSDAAATGGLMAFLGAYMIFVLAFAVFMAVVMWKLFEKAGKPGWAAIVPIYNVWVFAEVAGRPGWWGLGFLLSFIPVVGPLISLAISVILSIDVAKAFGKDPVFAILLVVLPFIGFPMLAFGDAKYTLPKHNSGGSAPAAPTTPAASA